MLKPEEKLRITKEIRIHPLEITEYTLLVQSFRTPPLFQFLLKCGNTLFKKI